MPKVANAKSKKDVDGQLKAEVIKWLARSKKQKNGS